ncbi:MAG: hypothetical protein P8X75_11900 [Limibacillus sp.]|jgi:hypothetical protein
MKKTAHVRHLTERIKDLELRLGADKARLETGTPSEKVEAAGDLALVERRIADLEEKLKKAEAEPEGFWERVKDELEEDIGSIETAFSRWTDKYSGL